MLYEVYYRSSIKTLWSSHIDVIQLDELSSDKGKGETIAHSTSNVRSGSVGRGKGASRECDGAGGRIGIVDVEGFGFPLIVFPSVARESETCRSPIQRESIETKVHET